MMSPVRSSRMPSRLPYGTGETDRVWGSEVASAVMARRSADPAAVDFRFDLGRKGQRADRLLVQWSQRLASSLRSGLPPSAALQATVNQAPSQAPDGAGRAAADLSRGRDLRASLDSWRQGAASESERLLIIALHVSVDRGADAAPAVDSVVERIRDDEMLRSRRRVLTAQARASAGVLVALPVAFGAFASLLRGELVYRGTSGLVILAVGVLLDLAGFAWMRRLRRRLL